MNSDIEEIILDVIREYESNTTEQLVKILVKKTNLSKEEIINKLFDLNKMGKIRYMDSNTQKNEKLISYLFSRKTLWFWVIMTILTISIGSFYLIEYDSPFIMIRYLSNLLLVFVIPGFVINKSFFNDREQSLDELIMGSLMLSILLVSTIGIIFHYSFIGLNINIILAVVSIVIIIFSFYSLKNVY